MNFKMDEGGENVRDDDFSWRVSMCLTKEQEEAILSMRQQDEYRRCSLSEVVRRLIDAGLNASGYKAKPEE